MVEQEIPLSRRGFLEGVGAGSAIAGLLALTSAQAAAESSVTENPPVEEVTVQSDVMVEMRDGTALATDIYLPAGAGPSDTARGPYPTLVCRTPYNKAYFGAQAKAFARHEYAVIVQDVRGRFASNGEFTPHRNEIEDGYDTVEWAATQAWSNGKVGTYGVSYMGSTQWGLAHNETLPPHLETMAPGFAHANYYADSAFVGGAFLLSHTLAYNHGLALDLEGLADETRTALERAHETLQQLYWDLPVDPYEPLQEADIPWLQERFANEAYSREYWGPLDHTHRYDAVDVPVLNYGGWYDIYTQGTVQNYQGLRDAGGADADTMLVMGPYTHAAEATQAQGMVTGSVYEFPANSTLDEMALQLAWFNRTLKGKRDTVGNPPVRVYVPGLDEWIGADDYPPTASEPTKYYLHSAGDANIDTIGGGSYEYGGTLSTEPPGEEPPDKYTYDPSDPVESVGGYNLYWRAGIADRATAYGNRDDILVYQTDILEEDIAVVGPITATLYASTSAVDTDFVVTLSDVEPTETAGGLLVAEGARRGRIGDVSADPRDAATYTEVTELEPGEVYEWQIGIWPTARVFEAGHRIRIDITSSDFPRYSRNLNTGEGLAGTEGVTADQTIFHDSERPSHVELPVVPMAELEAMTIPGPVPKRDGNGISH
ncbi:CocE/NonD family hydrolase [Natrinema sp. 1APR25-10V2]|uniref:CocE/NonD family hydrolase n=1 Tax=Natrinema sp. 1APR25-10V2 TaxID=2951081 RepID=UPI002875B3B8|nr:CocE/NonD family hydrolase [Natrinema sp. 1APR25-10V2]MDS0475718.1 CocE/NonD family hydrolase [Natrinema sp. 1APR25-10V2]